MNRMKEKNKATAVEFTFYDDPSGSLVPVDPLLKLLIQEWIEQIKAKRNEAPRKGIWFEIIA